MGIKTELNNVYRAKDCTDLNDIRTALEKCTEIVKRTGYWNNGTGAMYKRVCALHRKGDKIARKTSW